MNETKSKRLTISILQQRLDRIFSEYIRLRDFDFNGYCQCISCVKINYWKDGDRLKANKNLKN